MNHNFSIPAVPSQSLPTPSTAAEQGMDTLPGTTAPVSTELSAGTLPGTPPSPGCGERIFGYVRVSTREQNEARQLIALQSFGISPDHIFLDKQSGKDFHRPAWQALLNQLRPGDVLVVKSIDRLGRNYSDILDQWRYITKTVGAAIVVLDMPLLDTRNSRDLTGTLISDIVLQLLSYVAETERALSAHGKPKGLRRRGPAGSTSVAERCPSPMASPPYTTCGQRNVSAPWKPGGVSASATSPF